MDCISNKSHEVFKFKQWRQYKRNQNLTMLKARWLRKWYIKIQSQSVRNHIASLVQKLSLWCCMENNYCLFWALYENRDKDTVLNAEFIIVVQLMAH